MMDKAHWFQERLTCNSPLERLFLFRIFGASEKVIGAESMFDGHTQISVQSFLVWSSKTPPPFIARWGQWNNGRILGPLTDSFCVLRAGSNPHKAHWSQRHWWCALLRSSPAPTLTHSHHPQSWVKLVVICIIFPVLVTIFTDLCVPAHPGFNESFQHLNWASETVPTSFGDWLLTTVLSRRPAARSTIDFFNFWKYLICLTLCRMFCCCECIQLKDHFATTPMAMLH